MDIVLQKYVQFLCIVMHLYACIRTYISYIHDLHTKPNSSTPVLYHEMIRMFMKMAGF